ncbi:amidohydrolase family protein [Acidovorax sp. CCYZU-2555]|uniref:amidohydrolase family protein n=1 Tax=Acidovorax sp. CCYZU-2555 TaxID=2835042 RepID=UPI001BD08F25|nr:amidohydrolase family protein [Acidovorax sp. CCYZU-2555]MBS7777477.1 amidohydrolase family protein [Acidovorax sp. CCYZU-2555]
MTPDITGGIPAIDNHSHASMARFRTIDQIDRHFSTAHLEANVPAEIYDAFIAARNKGDTQTLEQLEAAHRTETLMQQGVAFRSTTFFARALREGLGRLYGPQASEEEQMATAREWSTRGPSYIYDQAVQVANTPIVLADVSYLDREVWNPQRYRQVMRIDPYVYPFHDGQSELRGTEFQRFHAGFAAVLHKELQRHGMQQPPQGFDEYLQFVDASVQQRVSEGVVSLKIASAYVRPIDFRPASYADAAAAYAGVSAGLADVDRRPLENFIVQRLAQFAADRGLPVQIHVGMGHPEPGMRIANGEPFLLETFLNIRSLNRLKVTLLHGGYPYSSQMAALAQTYGNVFLDFSWMPYLHHFYLRQKLSEWLEILPANKLLFGSDAGAPEFHVASAHFARQALNHVLNDGVQRGVWNAQQVDWLARRALHDNAAELHGFATL